MGPLHIFKPLSPSDMLGAVTISAKLLGTDFWGDTGQAAKPELYHPPENDRERQKEQADILTDMATVAVFYNIIIVLIFF